MRRVLVLLALVATGTFAPDAHAGSGRERHLAVYPPQRLPLRFDHDLHLAAGAGCEACHAAVKKSDKVSDWNLPKHPECEECHDIEAAKKGKKVDPPASCQLCHPGFDETAQRIPPRLELPTAHLSFSHAQHVEKKVPCKTCHGDVERVGLATRMQLPKMATCLECHDGKQAPSSCGSCHQKAPSGRLQLKFSSGLLTPMQGNPHGMDHGPRFEFTHGTRAQTQRETCMECHAQSDCNACHDALQKPLSVHPNDFITLHPLQARQDITRCESCHRMQSFCVACHERTGVGLNADPSLRPRRGRVHPDLQTWVEIPGPGHHAIPASRDIKQCVACHREETCLRCHAAPSETGRGTQGQGGTINPHPPGFKAKCRSMAAKNDRACQKCHGASGAVDRCE